MPRHMNELADEAYGRLCGAAFPLVAEIGKAAASNILAGIESTPVDGTELAERFARERTQEAAQILCMTIEFLAAMLGTDLRRPS